MRVPEWFPLWLDRWFNRHFPPDNLITCGACPERFLFRGRASDDESRVTAMAFANHLRAHDEAES